MQEQTIYSRLALLFEYPEEGYGERALECLEELSREKSPAALLLEKFCAEIRHLTTDELQELFTRTFDLNPVCTLEIGWHLYGEEYQRGEFLVKMRQQLRAQEVEESIELPDHLTHALTLLGRLEPDEAAEFAGQYLLPALDKMRAGWQKNHNAFRALLDAAFVLLESRYPYEPARLPARAPALRVLQ